MNRLVGLALSVFVVSLTLPAVAAEPTTPPKAVREVRPIYPSELLKDGISGSVLLTIEVKTDGTVGKVHVKNGLHPRLNKAAVDAAKQWHFKPGTRRGKPVRVETELEMSFTAK